MTSIWVAATRASLSQEPAVRELIRYATLAASGHNTQPWRFAIGRLGLFIQLVQRVAHSTVCLGQTSIL